MNIAFEDIYQRLTVVLSNAFSDKALIFNLVVIRINNIL
jgi:hypothetical protein